MINTLIEEPSKWFPWHQGGSSSIRLGYQQALGGRYVEIHGTHKQSLLKAYLFGLLSICVRLIPYLYHYIILYIQITNRNIESAAGPCSASKSLPCWPTHVTWQRESCEVISYGYGSYHSFWKQIYDLTYSWSEHYLTDSWHINQMYSWQKHAKSNKKKRKR